MLTEIIELPSKGRLYPKEHPLSSGTLEIKYMTAKEEDILTTQSFIEKGIVLDKLLDSVIVTEGVSSDDLTVGDKQMVLLQTRILAYGSEYEVVLDGKRHVVDLTKLKETGKPEFFNHSPLVEYELVKSKKKVLLKVLSSKEAKVIDDEIDALEKNGLNAGNVTTRLFHIIKEVDGNSDEAYIRKYVMEEMLAMESMGLRIFLEAVTPTVDFVTEINGQEVDIPIGINFFYPSTKI